MLNSGGARPKIMGHSSPNIDGGHPRRRKHSSGATRTVDIVRGRFGFGFTLSGQSPCILSSLIPDSPAERAGLKPGDALLSVNGQNVSRLSHSEVVRLISQSQGLIRVQVSEPVGGSDSSSDEEGSRPRARFPHKRNNRRDLSTMETNVNHQSQMGGDDDRLARLLVNANSSEERLSGRLPHMDRFSDEEGHRGRSRQTHFRSNSADSSLAGDVLLASSSSANNFQQQQQHLLATSTLRHPLPVRQERKKVELAATQELAIGGELREEVRPTLNELRKSIKIESVKRLPVEISTALLKCVVGYLGTIEMSVESGSRSGLEDIRHCIRRLRVEKKVHTLVLFCIFSDKVVLINHHGLKLAEFSAVSISFCGLCADDKKFFGLVTSQMSEEEEGIGTSSSCHVFMVEPTGSDHERIQRARVFNIQLSYNSKGENQEFPSNADPILSAIYSLKGVSPKEEDDDGEGDNMPDNASGSAASYSGSTNSDSGIGFKDDGLLVGGDINPAVLHTASPPTNRVSMKLTVRAMPDPAATTSSSNPNSADSSFNTDRLESLQSAEYIRQSMHKYLQDKREHLKRTSQQLAEKRSSPTSHDSGLQNVQRLIREKFEYQTDPVRQNRPLPYSPLRRTDRNDKTPTPSISERSFARSLEDLRSISQTERISLIDEGSGGAVAAGPLSLPIMSSLPLARFLCNSDSNLSQLEAAAGDGSSWTGAAAASLPTPQPHNHPLHRWLEKQGGGFSSVLRPCDQYPVEPVLLRHRPRSQISNRSNISHRSSMIEFSDYDNLSYTGGRVSAASTLSRKVARAPAIQEERQDKEFDRQSFSGDVDSLLCRRIPQPERTERERARPRRKSDSESIIEHSTGEEKGAEKDIGRVGGWAADFDKLLRDPAGLHTFAEFLRKEFSHENIFFWCACERYRRLESGQDRLRLAQDIVSKHLALGAAEPVNVDALARSSARDALQACGPDNPPDTNLFASAQLQIYNLMKFDSFSRFLKSDLYKESLLADMGGQALPMNGVDGFDPELKLSSSQDDSFELDKQRKKEAEGRRKSLLPWGNIRNRSKSKDRAEQGVGSGEKPFLFKAIKLPAQVAGRLSLNSNEAAGSRNNEAATSRNTEVSPDQTDNCDTEATCTLTRFILPDKATTVVTPTPGETIRWLVSRLLEKRGLRYTSFDAFISGSEKPLDLSQDCSTLGCNEVRVEPRVLFRLELPSKKSIGVKAKQTKLVEEVLRPILMQYGWNLDLMLVQVEREKDSRGTVDYNASVTSIDNCRLLVTYRSQELAMEDQTRRNSDVESIKSDSRPDSRSSDILNLNRRQSTSSVESRKQEVSGLMPPPSKIPSVRRRPQAPSPVLASREQEASLYEGLKRMTKGRLDDQRGLEINAELPEFLRKNERENSGGLESINRREDDLLARLSGPAELGDIHGWDRDHAHRYLDYIDSTFTSEGTIPTLEQADRLFSSSSNPEESFSFNESRLSLGMGRLSIDGMRVVSRPSIGLYKDYESVGRPPVRASLGRDYETVRTSLGMERDYEPVAFRHQPPLPHHPPQHNKLLHQPHLLHQQQQMHLPQAYLQQQLVMPPPPPMKPRQSSSGVGDDLRLVKRPPPLPPKPSRGILSQPPSGVGLGSGLMSQGAGLNGQGVGLMGRPAQHLPGDQGYNVSFV